MNAVGEAPGPSGSTLRDRTMLQRHLVHKREIPNGMDFLFMGPAEEIHEALKRLVSEEHRENRDLHLDYAQVDEYYLLRVVGETVSKETIRSYFDDR